jgi:hypothetical protein
MKYDDNWRVLFLLAGLISAAYAIAGLYWAAGGAGFPFGVENDPLAHHASILEGLSQTEGAPWLVATSVLGLVVVSTMARSGIGRRLTGVLAGVALLYGAGLALVIPDGRPLVAAAHIPVLLIGKPFGWPEGVTVASQVSWPVANQVILIVLGGLYAGCAVAVLRRESGACWRCGRSDQVPDWTHPARALRWGRLAVYVAMAVPAFYASTRLAWAFDVPFGVSRRFLEVERADSPSIFIAGAFMAMLALGGAGLTFGLVRPWGEVYPPWIPRLGGRPVRPRTAIIPATAVSFLMTGAGIGVHPATWDGNDPGTSRHRQPTRTPTAGVWVALHRTAFGAG